MRFASSSNEIRKKIQDYSYGLNDLIGKGFSSSVFKGMNQRTREQVAIKVIDLKSIRDRSKKQMLQGQIEALKKLNHNNIMKCHDIYSTQNNCYIITEFCNEGDLENLLKKRQKLPQSEAIPIFRDVVNGFRVIAENGFLHRDLKPANILMKDKVAKIADFGFAKKATNNPRDEINVGSPLYMSPQSLKYNIYTVKNDIWSLGIILYEILHGKTPWKASTEEQLKEKMTKQSFTMGSSLSEDLKDFIRKCLNSEESKRPGLNEFYNHPFIVRITQDDGIPQLLRKQTSINEKIELKQFKQQKQPRQPKLQKQKSTKQMKEAPKQLFHPFHNVSQNPTSLHHRKNNHNQENKTQKQLNSQLNFMRFLFRFITMFPPAEQSGRFTLGLRFLAKKLMLSQLYNLKMNIGKQNIFNFDNWDQFVSNPEKQTKYQQILDNYTKKYQSAQKELTDEVAIIGKDKTICSVVDTNYQRSEALSILGINYAIAQCKALLNQLKKVTSADAFKEQHSKKAMRLDFTITFYQLNSMLIDNFMDLDYFTRESKVEYIIEHKPAPLDYNNIRELEQKMMALEIIK